MLQYTTSLQGTVDSGDPAIRCLSAQAVGTRVPSVHQCTACGGGWWGSFSKMPHYMQHWAMALLLYTASLHGAVSSGDFSTLRYFMEQWAVGIL